MTRSPQRWIPAQPALLLAGALLALAACDHGLEPPEAPATGTIRGVISYADPAAWPPPDSLRDLRFFALPFVPRDTLDLFRDLNLLVFSGPLARYVATDSFVVEDVVARVYVYAGVAQQRSSDLLDWRPVGLAEMPGGFFEVRPGATTELTIRVDFRDPPPFPPGPAR